MRFYRDEGRGGTRSSARPRLLPLLMLLPLALGACRREAPTARPLPTAVAADLVGAPGGGEAPAPVLAPSAAEPLPTWTTPARGAPMPSAPAVAAQPGAGPETGLPGLARPTARPTEDLGKSPPPLDPEILSLMGRIDGARMLADATQLADFGTRSALSDARASGRGMGRARDWLLDAFERAGAGGPAQLLVAPEPFDQRLDGGITDQTNVIATLSGIGFSKRFIYLVAHYDSRPEDLMDGESDAPGADDNASGVAVLLELARVMRQRQWDGTIRFLATAAEEQGQHGARYHAEAAAEGALPIVAVLNNDIVGGTVDAAGEVDDAHLRIFSDGPDDGASRALARYATFMAARYRVATGIEAQLQPAADREGREGDHLAFHAAGYPALRLIEAAEDASRQHNALDTADRLDADYLARVARLNLVLAASLALAPPAPDAPPELAQLEEGLAASWAPVVDPAVSGYWLAIRGEGETTWREVAWVGGGATAHVFTDVGAGDSVVVAVASSSDLGHASRFGPEARR